MKLMPDLGGGFIEIQEKDKIENMHDYQTVVSEKVTGKTTIKLINSSSPYEKSKLTRIKSYSYGLNIDPRQVNY